MLSVFVAGTDVSNPLNPLDTLSSFVHQIQQGEELMAAGKPLTICNCDMKKY